MKDSAPSSSRARPRSVWIYLLAGIGLIAVAALVLVLVWLPSWILKEVERQAALRGVSLQDCSLSYERAGWLEVASLELTGCKVELAGAFPAHGTIERLHVELEEHIPKSVVVTGGTLEVRGELDWPGAKEQLDAMSRESFELLGEQNRIEWHSESGLPATIVLSQIKKTNEGDPWTADVAIMDLLEGTASVAEQLSLRLHMKAQPNNYVLVTLDPQRLRAHGTSQFERLPVAMLSGVLFQNTPKELANTSVDARIEFSVPLGLNTETPAGKFDLTLHGLNFPVPRELEGLVHDRAPQLSGELTSDRSYTKFDVSKLRFETGTLAMSGKARVQREGLATQWAATMQGSLPCSAIVASAAKVHLNTQLAKAARQISSRALRGAVNVFVAIDADSRDLAAAKVVKTVGVGCGLKPMPLTQLLNIPLDLLKDIPELAERIRQAPRPKKASQLPQLQLPELKDLPKLEIPRIQLPKIGNPEPRE